MLEFLGIVFIGYLIFQFFDSKQKKKTEFIAALNGQIRTLIKENKNYERGGFWHDTKDLPQYVQMIEYSDGHILICTLSDRLFDSNGNVFGLGQFDVQKNITLKMVEKGECTGYVFIRIDPDFIKNRGLRKIDVYYQTHGRKFIDFHI